MDNDDDFDIIDNTLNLTIDVDDDREDEMEEEEEENEEEGQKNNNKKNNTKADQSIIGYAKTINLNIDLNKAFNWYKENYIGKFDLENNEPPEITSNGDYTTTDSNNNNYQEINNYTPPALTKSTEPNTKKTRSLYSNYFKVNVTPHTTTKTITIDSIGNNQSTTYNASSDNVDGFSSVTIINNTSSAVPLEDKTVEYTPGGNLPTITVSNGYYGIRSINFTPITSGFECVKLFEGVTINDVYDRINTELGKDYSLKTVSFNNKYYAFDNTTITAQQLYNLITGNVTEDIRTYGDNYVYIWADTPFILNSIFCYIDGTMILYGSNDAIVWNKLTNEFYKNSSPQHFPNLTLSWKFYRLYYRGHGSNVSHTSTVTPYFCIDSSYNYNNLNLEHNKQITLSNSDVNSTIYLNPSTGYNGFSNAIITVPNIQSNPNLYNDYTSNSPLVISNSGTGSINIPSGYDGLGTIYYNITVPQWSPIHFSKAQFFKSNNTSSSTINDLNNTASSSYTLRNTYCCLFINKNTNAYMYVGNINGNNESITVTLPSGSWAYSEIPLNIPYDSSNPVSCNILTNNDETIVTVKCVYHYTSFTASSTGSLDVQQYKFSLN